MPLYRRPVNADALARNLASITANQQTAARRPAGNIADPTPPAAVVDPSETTLALLEGSHRDR
jgi:hypothetical protein